MDTGILMERIKSKQGLALIAVAALCLIVMIRLAILAHDRSAVQDVLNSSAPIISPPLELQFAARQPDNPDKRAVFMPGVAAGYWGIRSGAGSGGMEIILTREGQKLFTVVGSSIIAGFHAGTRHITKITKLEDTDTTREISFDYVWTSVQPATSVLGKRAPSTGQTYQGQAILVRSGESWQIAHWTMPELDDALKEFQ